MRILILSPYAEELRASIEATGDTITAQDTPLEDQDADFVVSYGYRHIIGEPHLSRYGGRMINLHISLLPWNKGADPNFWSWFDGTPKGVTIHGIDEKIDTGPILASAPVAFQGDETLASSYQLLRARMVNLFAEIWPEIRNGNLRAEPMRGHGSYHRARDKERYWRQLPLGNHTPVREVEALGASVARCGRGDLPDQIAQYLATIDEIEKVRTANNVNWMDLLRLAFKVAPDEAKKLVRRINADDHKISELLARLAGSG
jgi:methionyl-tRNA formyltransferase